MSLRDTPNYEKFVIFVGPRCGLHSRDELFVAETQRMPRKAV